MAKAFAERGMNVAIADIDAAQLEKAEQELQSHNNQVLTLSVDVTDREAMRAAADKVIERFSKVHIVCANAGVSGQMAPLQEGQDENWDWVIDVNINGTVNTIQAFLPHLLQNPNDAHIVITSSISGLRVYKPSRGQGMYNTTKYALVGLGEALSLDLEPEGIGVSLLCPGVVNTRISHSGLQRGEKYGGAFDANAGHELAKAATTGTDPLVFGRWVIKAVENNQLYVITHAGDRELVADRHRKILAAFDACAELTADS